MTLICECGSYDILITEQSYPEDEYGNATGVAFEAYECQLCGRTGTYRFGQRDGRRVEEMSGCLTTDFDQ